jgi:hypothetical protein
LHSAIGMMDQAATRRPPRGDRLIQCGNGERSIERVIERPADNPARERIEDDGEIGEGLGEMDIGDVGDPGLIGRQGGALCRQSLRPSRRSGSSAAILTSDVSYYSKYSNDELPERGIIRVWENDTFQPAAPLAAIGDLQ